MWTGWIKIYRQLLNWSWYHDHNTCRLFIHLLFRANYRDGMWKGLTIRRGQLVIGRVALAIEVGLSEQQVRTALIKLKSTNDITITTTNKFSIITICNYAKYQDGDSLEQPAIQPTGQPLNNQQITTSKEGKKLRKNTLCDKPASDDAELAQQKNGKGFDQTAFDQFWDAFDYKRGKKQAMNAWAKIADMSPGLADKIVDGAKQYASQRPVLIAKGLTPKMAQGWLEDSRWEDEPMLLPGTTQGQTCAACRYNRPGGCEQPGTVCDEWAGGI